MVLMQSLIESLAFSITSKHFLNELKYKQDKKKHVELVEGSEEEKKDILP